MIANGEITIEELAAANDLIERAQFVTKALEACRKSLVFPIGVSQIQCYSYTDRAGEYYSWGTCTNTGIFRCWCNWGGDHIIGEVDLTNYTEVFLSFDNQEEFAHDLKRFLSNQLDSTK